MRRSQENDDFLLCSSTIDCEEQFLTKEDKTRALEVAWGDIFDPLIKNLENFTDNRAEEETEWMGDPNNFYFYDQEPPESVKTVWPIGVNSKVAVCWVAKKTNYVRLNEEYMQSEIEELKIFVRDVAMTCETKQDFLLLRRKVAGICRATGKLGKLENGFISMIKKVEEQILDGEQIKKEGDMEAEQKEIKDSNTRVHGRPNQKFGISRVIFSNQENGIADTIEEERKFDIKPAKEMQTHRGFLYFYSISGKGKWHQSKNKMTVKPTDTLRLGEKYLIHATNDRVTLFQVRGKSVIELETHKWSTETFGSVVNDVDCSDNYVYVSLRDTGVLVFDRNSDQKDAMLLYPVHEKLAFPMVTTLCADPQDPNIFWIGTNYGVVLAYDALQQDVPYDRRLHTVRNHYATDITNLKLVHDTISFIDKCNVTIRDVTPSPGDMVSDLSLQGRYTLKSEYDIPCDWDRCGGMVAVMEKDNYCTLQNRSSIFKGHITIIPPPKHYGNRSQNPQDRFFWFNWHPKVKLLRRKVVLLYPDGGIRTININPKEPFLDEKREIKKNQKSIGEEEKPIVWE